MEKTLVILFANDTMISVYPSKVKALLPIGNIPCLSVCIKSFIEALKTNTVFVIITNSSHQEEMRTELSRWHPSEDLNGIFFRFKIIESFDHRNASTLNSVIQDLKENEELFHNVFISDCSFPLLGAEVIKNMSRKRQGPWALVGVFTDPKFTLSRRLLDGVQITANNVLSFPPFPENNKIFPYYFMNTVHLSFEQFLCTFSPKNESINYYHLLSPLRAFLLPSYYMKFEGVPFMLCNDRIYLDNLYWKKKNTEHLQYINNIWLKWIDVNNRLIAIEKKIEKLKSLSKPKKQNLT